MKRALIMHGNDNIVNVIDDVKKGEEFAYVFNGATYKFAAHEDIPFGFKAAVKAISAGGDILKYNQVIGKASRDIAPGDCVHIHNVEGKRGRGDQEVA